LAANAPPHQKTAAAHAGSWNCAANTHLSISYNEWKRLSKMKMPTALQNYASLGCWMLIDRFDRRRVNRRLKEHFTATNKTEIATERGGAQ